MKEGHLIDESCLFVSRVKVENKFNKNLRFEVIEGRMKGSETRAVYCDICTWDVNRRETGCVGAMALEMEIEMLGKLRKERPRR